MVWTKPLTLSVFGNLFLKKIIFSKFFWPTFVRKNRWKMTNCIETMVYIGLQDIENNGVSDWSKKKSIRLVAFTCAATRKLQSINEHFLATKRGFKRLYKVD